MMGLDFLSVLRKKKKVEHMTSIKPFEKNILPNSLERGEIESLVLVEKMRKKFLMIIRRKPKTKKFLSNSFFGKGNFFSKKI